MLAIYSKKDAEGIKWDEQHLYGSNRLGMWRWDTLVPAAPPVVGGATSIYDSLLLGSRSYELSNHLGNVLVTISDKKIGVDVNTDGTVDYYTAEVVTASDFYPGGMDMPGRKFSNGNQYRYGFQTQEKSTEINESSYTAEFWQYDARIVRRWNLDPRPIVSISSYAAFANNPIWYMDHRGDTSINGEAHEGMNANSATMIGGVTVYSKNHHKSLSPVVSDLYDNQRLNNVVDVTKDLAKILWNDSELKKKIMKSLPPVPGMPSVLDVTKELSEHYAPGLYGAASAIVKNKDNAIDMGAAGVGLIYPYVGVAYELVLKRIFLDESIKETNLGVFQLVDANWRSTGAFNHVVQNKPMLRGGEYIGVITVTIEQFYEIMDKKVFVPSDYQFYPINQYNINDISKQYFNGEIPSFNIYFNSLGSKGFLHISEVGIAPVRTK